MSEISLFEARLRPDPALEGWLSFRRQFVRKISLPLAFMIVAVLTLGATGIVMFASQADKAAIERQMRTTEHVLSDSIDALAHQQTTIARSPMLTVKLAEPQLDDAWLDANIGRGMYDLFDHELVAVLDAHDRPVYLSVLGEYVDSSEYAAVAEYLQPLVDGARGRLSGPGGIHSRRLGRPLAAGSTVRTSPELVHESDAMRVLTRPAAASAMLIRSHNSPRIRSGGNLLVSLRFLDGDYLKEIAERDLIDDLRFWPTDERGPGEQSLAFRNSYGDLVGYYIWKPVLPGARIVEKIAPIAILVVAALIGAMLLLGRTVWQSGSRMAMLVQKLQQSEAAAQQLAYHDTLTKLPNRALLNQRLDQALARADRGAGCTVLAVDLDRFKHVNDTFGHHAGDALIREIARRFAEITRTGDTVARVGGDEFIILLEGVTERREIDAFCDRLRQVAMQPVTVPGGESFVGVSIGIAIAPRDGVERFQILRKADVALYRAKAEGRNCARLFTGAMDEEIRFRSAIEEDLRAALACGTELRVCYQPELRLADEAIVGLEALVRWEHPTRGLIMPDAFIPVAEETGLIDAVGEWVLAQACQIAQRWPDLFVAVNLSPKQIKSDQFVARTIGIVRDAGCDPSQIELEVTETALITDSVVTMTRLEQLRAAGFRIALDDFGTGYSSLTWLKKFKVDKIKIDRSFTQSIGHSRDVEAIVGSVITLGHAMGLAVTGEGVETHVEREFLRKAGCDQVQGYLISRPVPEDRLPALLRDPMARGHASDRAA